VSGWWLLIALALLVATVVALVVKAKRERVRRYAAADTAPLQSWSVIELPDLQHTTRAPRVYAQPRSAPAASAPLYEAGDDTLSTLLVINALTSANEQSHHHHNSETTDTASSWSGSDSYDCGSSDSGGSDSGGGGCD